jgi:hypothetical protein
LNTDLLDKYNYDAFVPDKFMHWMRFSESPALGEDIPDFSLWPLDSEPTSLHEVIQNHRYTVIEFGSFT